MSTSFLTATKSLLHFKDQTVNAI